MFRTTTIALVILSAFAQSGIAQEWAKKMFTVTSHDFGSVARGAKSEFRFELQNKYVEDIHISRVRSSCGCTTPTITKDTLKTWEKSEIVAKYNTNSFLGKKSATLTVTIDRPFYAEVQLYVSGYIRSDVVFDPGIVAFGTVEASTAVQRTVNLSYAGRTDWEIVDIRSENADLQVELKETGRGRGRVNYQMVVFLSDSAKAGYLQDQLTIVTNDNRLKHIPLMVEGRVLSPLTVSPASLFLGVVGPGKKVTKTLIVRSKKPFKVLNVKCEDNCFEFKTSEDAKALHVIPVTFTAGQKPGKVAQSIVIETDLASGTEANCIATATVKSEN